MLLLLFTTPVYFVVAGLFLYSFLSQCFTSLFFFFFLLPKSYPALQLLSNLLIYHRKGKETEGGEGEEAARERERERGVSERTNVVTANGFIGMIPVINYAGPS